MMYRYMLAYSWLFPSMVLTTVQAGTKAGSLQDMWIKSRDDETSI